MSAQATENLMRRRFTIEEYERMGQTGILGEDDRVELLGGEIVQMTPIGPVHAAVVDRLNRVLVQRLGDRAIVRVQNPVRVDSHSEPQPDLVVARDRSDFYQLGHPTPDDILLAIEVADSSLAVDRAVKVPLYARAGIAEMWLVDLVARTVLVHRGPRDGEYAQVRPARPGEDVSLAAFADVILAIAEILGER
jgi:Uma2 family endonuclease